MSIVDKYRQDDPPRAENLQQYADQHKKYESQINDLSQQRQQHFQEHIDLDADLKAMDREEDPQAYDALEKKVDEKGYDLQDTDKRLEETQTEFDQYKRDNQQYADSYEQALETQDALKQQGIDDSPEAPEKTAEEIGQNLQGQGIEEQEAESDIFQGNANLADDYQGNYTASNEPAQPESPARNESIAAAQAAVKEQGLDKQLQQQEVQHEPEQPSMDDDR